MSITKTTKKMNVEIYTTSDGMTFTLPSQAEYHERSIQDTRIRRELHSMKMEFPFLDAALDGNWYLISNQEQIEYFTRKYTSPNNYDFVNHNRNAKIELGDWVAIEYEIKDGEREHCGVVTLAYIIEQMKGFISDAEEITVEGKY